MANRLRVGVAIGISIVLAVAGVGFWWYQSSAHGLSRGPTYPYVQHVFVIVQENHGYDNYFGAYCQQRSAVCSSTGSGIPPGVCEPYTLPAAGSNACLSPYPLSSYARPTGALNNGPKAASIAWDGGAMDGFLAASHGNNITMGFYTNSSISAYWDLAEEYGLGDEFFSSVLGPSIANHWMLISGVAPSASYGADDFGSFSSQGALNTQGQEYLSEANSTPTLADQLQSAGLSWRVYDTAVPAGGYSLFLSRALAGQTPGSTFNPYDPFLAKGSTYSAAYAPHFVTRYSIADDAREGTLANVSWFFPSVPQSEEPPAQLYYGEGWVLSVINAIEASPEWNTSLIFLTWDDWGGWYDSVAPPNEGAYGPGFRMPLIVIGPYVHPNLIDHSMSTFPSIAGFIETNFGLPGLGLASGQGASLNGYLDLQAPPRAPMNFTVNETYPLPLQGG